MDFCIISFSKLNCYLLQFNSINLCIEKSALALLGSFIFISGREKKKVIEIDGISMRKKMRNFTNVNPENFTRKGL
jgi:hypothetical protein